jgi:hypothetical protein
MKKENAKSERELEELRRDNERLKMENDRKKRELTELKKEMRYGWERVNLESHEMDDERTLDSLKAGEKCRSAHYRRILPSNERYNYDITKSITGEKSEYVMVNYHNKYEERVKNATEQDELDIDDEDVVRAENGKYFLREELSKCELKNTHEYPTYGLCGWCFTIGPVNMLCQACPCDQYSRSYEAAYTHLSDRSTCWLDCENIARIMDTKIYKEKANRKNTCLDCSCIEVTREMLNIGLVDRFTFHEITKEELEQKKLEVDKLWQDLEYGHQGKM